MNKKYLSALLFGALTVASTGTFTSCKDYDDEIADLQEQMDKKATAEELNTQISALQSSVASAKSTAEQALKEAQEAMKKAEEALANGGSANSNGITKEEAQTMIDAAVSKLATIERMEKELANLQKSIDACASQEALNEVQKQIAAVDKVLKEMTSVLTGLVFAPDFYYQGIEAMEAPTYQYNSLSLKAVDANGSFGTDAPSAEVEYTYYTPGLVANYHLNPSYISEDALPVEKLSFLADNKKYTRANDVVKPSIYKRVVKNGILTVTAHLTEGEIKNIEKDGEVTVLALQANVSNGKQDTIITSDYAAVKRTETTIVALANAKDVNPAHKSHLAKTAPEAIKGEAMIKLAWNDTKGVDIAEYVQTHVINGSEKAPAVDSEWDVNANAGTVEKVGFKYEYELVGYQEGDNKTSESAHAAWNPEDVSVLRAQMTNEGKQQAWGAEQSKATIGREPLVRVKLIDTVSNKIAAVGYIKVQIVADEVIQKDEITVIPEFPFDNDYTLNCSTEDLTHTLVWHQVEEKIIAKLGISKDQFEKEYDFDGFELNDRETGVPATQFTTTDDKAVAVEKPLGIVVKTTDDQASTETEIIKWTLTANEAFEQFLKVTTLKVNVRFVKTNTNGTHHYVYVTMNWTPKTLNVNPKGAIENSNKIAEYWFKKYEKVSKTGYDEIHMNVKVPTSATDTDCSFEKRMEEVFAGEKVTISNIDKVYTDYQDAELTKTFKFVTPDVKEAMGVSGKTYILGASENGECFTATEKDKVGALPVCIAKIEMNKVVYQDNDVAKDLLNYADHSELGAHQTLTAKVQIVATGCKDHVLPLDNDKFDVRFLRPLTIGDKKNDGLVDGKDAGDEIDLAKVLTFKDWREIEFSPAGYDYFKYYGVKTVTADVDKITTDLNNGTLGKTLLTEVQPKIKITFAPEKGAINNEHMGILNYKNNGVVLGSQYNIRVPVIVEYTWGTIKKEVDIVVNPTIAQ